MEMANLCFHLHSIVALHGLQGHAWNSFTTSNIINQNAGRLKETNWLRDLLPRLLEQNQQQKIYPRVMTYGYNADVWMTKSATEIDEPADNLISYLNTERETVCYLSYYAESSDDPYSVGSSAAIILRWTQSRWNCH